MNILFFVGSFSMFHNLRIELAEKLVKEHHNVYVLLPDTDVIDKTISNDFEYIFCSLNRRGKNPFRDLLLLHQYKRILKRIKPDVVLLYTTKMCIYGGIACKEMHIPYIECVCGLGDALEKHGLLQKITMKLYKIALKRASMVFFQNIENQSFMLKNKIINNKTNYSLLPGSGVNLTKHTYKEYPINDLEIKLLYIGRLIKDKGISELIECAKIIKQKYSNVKFYALGTYEKDYYNELQALNADKYITMLGFHSNVDEYIQNSHAIIHPSYHEGMANVLLESAACGRPVLASNIPGCIETFDEGITGFGFEPKNVDSMCKTIEKFLALSNEEKAQMGKKGRKKIENEFDRNIIVDRYMKEIERIVTK